MRNINFELATKADDASLRRILRENPFPGAISISFEREPSYFRAATIEGPFHQTVIAREQGTGEIIGMGTRSIRPVYVNGNVQTIGYLSQVRFTPQFKRGLYFARGLAQGMQFFRTLHADGRAPFYFSSIIADNAPARRLFPSGLAGMPQFREYAHMFTYAVATRRLKRDLPLPRGLRLTRGSPDHIEAIVDVLQRNGARRQFAPYWTTETLFNPEHTPDLSPSDFFLAMDGTRVVGCIACWDQMQFKQSVVRGYSGTLGRWRKWINLAARIGYWLELPPPQTALRYCHASHLAFDDDDTDVFAALLRAVYNHAAAAGYICFMIGLSEQDPLRPVLLKSYRCITYPSQIYLVTWEDGEEAISQIDQRIPGFDIALL